MRATRRSFLKFLGIGAAAASGVSAGGAMALPAASVKPLTGSLLVPVELMADADFDICSHLEHVALQESARMEALYLAQDEHELIHGTGCCEPRGYIAMRSNAAEWPGDDR